MRDDGWGTTILLFLVVLIALFAMRNVYHTGECRGSLEYARTVQDTLTIIASKGCSLNK